MVNNNEIYNFCTIFDSVYLSKGLALYYSLEKVCNFKLYVFTSDKDCLRSLEERNLDKLIIVNLKDIENEKLLDLKDKRDTGEYYWTLKAHCITHLFNSVNLDLVSYIDADIFFYSSPKPLFDELGENSVLITPHNFSPTYKNDIKNGIYNAGYITFRNDEAGRNALRWWKDRCVEWCYRKKEGGKFGDQLYLNTLSAFEGVHSLFHKGILANWNVQQYRFIIKNNSIEGITSLNKSFKVIFFHFHYLTFYTNGEVELGRRLISKEIINLFYKPYIKMLYESIPPKFNTISKKPLNWKTPILYVKRKIENTYNIYSLSDLISD
jgi:hypothetical protein